MLMSSLSSVSVPSFESFCDTASWSDGYAYSEIIVTRRNRTVTMRRSMGKIVLIILLMNDVPISSGTAILATTPKWHVRIDQAGGQKA